MVVRRRCCVLDDWDAGAEVGVGLVAPVSDKSDYVIFLTGRSRVCNNLACRVATPSRPGVCAYCQCAC